MRIFELINTAPWTERAKCREVYPDAFFPATDAPASKKRLARRTCQDCPVTAECLDAGMGEKYGIWGGLTEQERATLRRTGKS
ncbi:WhiB family transcriptional regulator [Williamsia sp. DF01-3]|uniref:WhiB family transcriptional regulator n=1 Tax=Williamsia sp. DF01-3 TaxID=2934157 RepID=UPI001FF393E1|nr:WhiB family transcriptional regulator [Williamsia sp. DF01-3]MCK0517898.1 WhiB family transcriptional regulator [Williamsia sp. DF01-3]